MPALSPVRSPARSAAASPKGVRSDPVHRPISTDILDVQDKDPEKHYVWAYKGDQATGVDYYLQLGYEPVLWPKEGVKTARPYGRLGTAGQEIERMGNVLMAISMEERRRIEQHGINGRGGLQMVKERQARILKQSNSLIRDIPGIRGSSGDAVVSVQNETTATTEIEVEA